MSLDTLSDFIAAIDRIGELHRISTPVKVHLEITEIADRVSKMPGGGKALLFEQPVLRDGRTSPYPVAINLFGSMRRMALALGVDDLDAIGDRITRLLDLKVPEGFLGKLSLLPRLLEIAKFPPRTKGGAPACQEIVWRGADIDLDQLPILHCWPEDGGPFLTMTAVISQDPVRGIRNVGMYRVQQLDKSSVAMHWQRHKTGAEHMRQMAERGEKMPVCIVIGCDPASMYSASAPLPPNIDEFLFAGFLRKEPVRLTRAVSCDLEVPADADFVIEGYIDPAEALAVEGPFGDHTGFYSEADLYPRVHVTAVTMRRNPVYVTTIVGRPPMEDFYLGHATERIFLPLLKLTTPEVVDYHMPAEGGFHNLVFVSIDKKYPGHADKVMHALWGQGLMSLAKVLVVVDKEINVRNPVEAWWVALNNMDPERDVRFTMGPVDVLDHASRAFTYGSKMGIDATRKWPEEGFTRAWPKVISMDDATRARVDALWLTMGLPPTGRS
jgi:4-hydroxy-3-polyprenylbenzoate decarboxylase